MHSDGAVVLQIVHGTLSDPLGATRRSRGESRSAPPESPAAARAAVREQAGRTGNTRAIGDEENVDRQNGESLESRMRHARRLLHQTVLATQ